MYVEYKKLASWDATTTKPGYPIKNIIDDSTATFWQSCGEQPHAIQARFDRKICVSFFDVFSSPHEDDNFTPLYVSLRYRTFGGEMKYVKTFVYSQECQWLSFPLFEDKSKPYVWTDLIQFVIHSNQEEGIDSRIRQVSIRGPVPI
ncbi:putative anaphase promoting complex subunit 10-like family protein [Monocercomonoides exilis]|uniref:putative anaphase promoting complex subunit 10-like family protein n=1 Tax=Monocercomonoides exilis TaxID=2049356 RepID=UPI00355ACA33|nr:putative anaphase promoting complex subunit 10-like family protein [Monocercomonoides exilis]|eukprot:MONOS_5309.1-p1 / transcript=MONOS_5309.1 / gene=MONOS_5309 / organism=Monocercomonoides_exilis_PA203 / gene_product=anaphase promoting complex subunit 10-like family protein, putative / transcript_product=anaphase promoting complex subunit 10-like family protein, putative / location=Mono_scaffold00153:21428-22118(+) / protein_length=145 / sequence_SO=supercontig / SO=protein_coding / is_pseudo=false